MAAIVRSRARRLAGSAQLLQRAPAAGAMFQRAQASGPFPAKLMSTTEQHALALPQSLSKAEHEIQKKVLLKTKIQERKEELYDLISVTETSVHTDSANRLLLHSLSAQIKPRPDDSKWRFICASKRRSDVIRPAGIATGLILGFGSTLLLLALKDISQDILKEQQEEKAAAANKKAATEEEVAPL